MGLLSILVLAGGAFVAGSAVDDIIIANGSALSSGQAGSLVVIAGIVLVVANNIKKEAKPVVEKASE